MSELLDLIKNLKVETEQSSTSFVYYDKIGKIVKVSNKNVNDENLKVLEVPTDHVKSIINGERKLSDFRVTFDTALKSNIVKEITWEDDYTNELDSIFEIPKVVRGGYKKDFYKHYHYIPVYEGVNVYLYLNGFSYKKGMLVWYKYNVYKTIKDTVDTEFNLDCFEIYLEDVVLVNKPQSTISAEHITYKREFEGIPRIDIWYKDLAYVEGQHVWINKNVYRLTKDYPAGSVFDYENSVLITYGVKLYADENKNLEYDNSISVGDLILNHNKIERVILERIETGTPKEIDDNLFYANETNLISYDRGERKWKGVNLSTKEQYWVGDDIRIAEPDDFLTGQLTIIGKSIHLAKIDHTYDLIVMQNLNKGYWEIELNPRTRKFLKSSGFYPKDYLIFSLTAKHDPHILYRTFEFKLSDLIEENKQIVPFKYDIERKGVELSLYTPKYFDNYAHEIIND